MIDAQMLTHHKRREKQYCGLKHNKIYISRGEQRCTQVAQVAGTFAVVLPVPLCNA